MPGDVVLEKARLAEGAITLAEECLGAERRVASVDYDRHRAQLGEGATVEAEEVGADLDRLGTAVDGIEDGVAAGRVDIRRLDQDPTHQGAAFIGEGDAEARRRMAVVGTPVEV